jgi:uncharacterized radical SAM superfamily protein
MKFKIRNDFLGAHENQGKGEMVVERVPCLYGCGRRKMSRVLWACYPHPRFPTLSITGNMCALHCKHCEGHYLRYMLPCTTPEELRSTCLALASGGARGVLLSGGCNSEGYVPFEPFIDAIELVKRETKLFLSIHPGLMPRWLAHELGKAGVDMADFDFVGDDETIKLVLGIDRKVRDYRRTLKALIGEIPYVSPHICVGLHAGKLKGERRALEMISDLDITTLVFLTLVPTWGTKFEDVGSPSPEVLAELISEARSKFPDIPLALGCMRPRDGRRVELELAALQSGIDRIEMPSERTIEIARGLGFTVRRLDACCAIPTEIVEASNWSST